MDGRCRDRSLLLLIEELVDTKFVPRETRASVGKEIAYVLVLLRPSEYLQISFHSTTRLDRQTNY